MTEYTPKRSGISPASRRVSLENMVAARNNFSGAAWRALGCPSATVSRAISETKLSGEDAVKLQNVLAGLLSCSEAQLRERCDAVDVPRQGDKDALIERLVGWIAACMHEERRVAEERAGTRR